MEKHIRKIEKYIAENRLLTKGARVLVGLSGGPDSVCLATTLVQLGYKVVACHCNFHLRGEESMRDEKFAEALANKLNTEWHRTDFDTISYAKNNNISIEMAAREQRYAWFEALRQQTNCVAIAVGHHSDDNIETFILNIVRSTGIKGVSAIQPKNGHIVRPLLCITRKDVIEFLQDINQEFIIDHTNLEEIYARNKVRIDIIPRLANITPSATENIASTIENLNEVRKIYEVSIRASINACCHTNNYGELIIDKTTLLSQPSPISVLHEVLSPLGFNKSTLTDIINRINECGRIFIGTSLRLLVDRTNLIVEANSYESPQIKTTTIERKDLHMVADSKYAYLDADNIKHELSLRTPLPGDTFAPFGMNGKRKLLSDFLTDRKLSRFAKEHQCLLCDGDEIVWVVGLRSSELYRVNDETKHVIVVSCE